MNEILKSPDSFVKFGVMEEEGFTNLLAEIADTDIWLDVPANEIRVDVSKEGTLLIRLGECGEYEMFPQATPSFRARSGNEKASILDKLDAEETAKVFNIYWPKCEGICKVLIRGGKILAMHTNRYIPFQQKRLFASAKNIFCDKYDKAVFETASYTHVNTTAVYEIVSARLLSSYRLALSAVGITASKDVRAFVEISTNDYGTSSVSLTPSISLNHNERVFISNPVTIEHRDNKTMEKCEGEMEKIFAAMSNGIANMRRLLGIELTYPSSVAIRLATSKKWNLPGGLIKELIPELKIPEMMGIPMNAHNFYMTLCEIFEMEGFEALSPARKLKVKELLAKIALLPEAEWQALDVNDISW